MLNCSFSCQRHEKEQFDKFVYSDGYRKMTYYPLSIAPPIVIGAIGGIHELNARLPGRANPDEIVVEESLPAGTYEGGQKD